MRCSCTNCGIKRFFSLSRPRGEQREVPAEDTSPLPGEGVLSQDAFRLQRWRKRTRGRTERTGVCTWSPVSGPRDSRRGSCTWPLVWKVPPWSHRHGSQSTLVTTHRGSPTPQTSPRYPPPRPTLPSAHGSSHQCWVLPTEGGTSGTALLCPAARNTLEPDKLTDTLVLTSGRWPRGLHVQAF